MGLSVGGVLTRRRITPEYVLWPQGNRTLLLLPTEPGSSGRVALQGNVTRLNALDLGLICYPKGARLGAGLSPYRDGRSKLLKHIFHSRSLWWHSTGRKITQFGGRRDLEISWERGGRSWGMRLGVAGLPHAWVLGEFCEFYVDPDAGRAGWLKSAFPAEYVQRVIGKPTLSVEEAAAFCREVRAQFPNDTCPLPEAQALQLSRIDYAQATLTQEEGSVSIEVEFSYGDNLLLGFTDEEIVKDVEFEGSTYRVCRDLAAERARFSELEKAVPGISLTSKTFYPLEQSPVAAWKRMQPLRALGWEVTTDPSISMRPIEVVDARLESHADGYKVSCRTEILGELVDLIPLIIHYLKSSTASLESFAGGCEDWTDDTSIFLYSEDRSIQVSWPMIRHVMRHMAEVLLEGRDPYQIVSRLDAARVLEQSSRWTAPAALRNQARHFAAPPPQAVPAGIKADLRSYQQKGVDRMRLWQHYRLNGILADEMGTGKTLQVIALLLAQRGKGPSLIIAPTSVLPNWKAEMEKFAPALRAVVWHGPQRHHQVDLAGADVIITNYALMADAPFDLVERSYFYVVLDEAQNIKNHKSRARAVLDGLSSAHRLCLTGTPIENHLSELWSLLDYLNHGILGEESHFRTFYRRPIEEGNDQRRRMLLEKIAPLILRRTKHDVQLPIPPKEGEIVRVALSAAQRALYDGVHVAVAREIQEAIADKGLRQSQIKIFAALLKLRQVCCDSRLLKHKVTSHPRSAKLDQLMREVKRRVGQGSRVLVFSQFAEMLDLIGQAAAGIPFVRLDGSMVDRGTPVKQFQAGKVPLFLISLKAGGAGINLTAADTVMIYDPWWNPAIEAQAIDRAHRLGQDKTVTYQRFICADTIEERILVLQEKKRKIAASILDDAGGVRGAKLTEEDLKFLLG